MGLLSKLKSTLIKATPDSIPADAADDQTAITLQKEQAHTENKAWDGNQGEDEAAVSLEPNTIIGGREVFAGQGDDEVTGMAKVIIDQYMVKEKLGAGGMSDVYRVVSLDLNLSLALKLLKPHFSADEKLKRFFIREAEAWIGFGDHPNILQAYEIVKLESETGIIMELAPGGSLADRLSRGQVDIETGIEYAIQICRGMIAAHDNGLVHRDLKPGNLLFSADNALKVTDFGLVMHDDIHDSQTDIAGTPEYMAPELWSGDISRAVDIYAFGVILYQIFCGRLPFYFPDSHPSARFSLYEKAHCSEDPPDPMTVRPDMPKELAELILGCLAKSPEQRPVDFRSIFKTIKPEDQITEKAESEKLSALEKVEHARSLLKPLAPMMEALVDSLPALLNGSVNAEQSKALLDGGIGHNEKIRILDKILAMLADSYTELFQEYIEQGQAVAMEEHLRDCCLTCVYLGNIWMHLGMHEEAHRMFQENAAYARKMRYNGANYIKYSESVIPAILNGVVNGRETTKLCPITGKTLPLHINVCFSPSLKSEISVDEAKAWPDNIRKAIEKGGGQFEFSISAASCDEKAFRADPDSNVPTLEVVLLVEGIKKMDSNTKTIFLTNLEMLIYQSGRKGTVQFVS